MPHPTARARLTVTILTLSISWSALQAQEPDRNSDDIQIALQTRLTELHRNSGAPGVVAGVVLADGTSIGLAAGWSDTVAGMPMTTSDRLLQGSVGKTYVSAVALQLVGEGSLDLGTKVSHYLGDEDWFTHLPNHADITVRQLMNHTSGIIRY